MKIPRIFIKDKKKYYFIELCKNFARYQTSNGVVECFGFHDLQLIEETKRIREASKGGAIKV